MRLDGLRRSQHALPRTLALLLVAVACEAGPTVPPADVPAIASIHPQALVRGSTGFTLRVRGENFSATSRVHWNGVERATTLIADSLLTAVILPADVSAAGSATVTVVTPMGSGHVTAARTFTTTDPIPLTFAVATVSAPGGTWDASVSSSGDVYLGSFLTPSVVRLDVATNALVPPAITVGNWPYEVAFNQTGARAFTSNLDDSTVSVINTATRTVVETFTLPSRPIRVRPEPNGSRLWVTLIDGNVLALNPETGANVHPPLAIGGVLNGLALVPGGSTLWVTNTSGDVAEINAVTGEAGRSFVLSGTVQDVVVSADGARMYVANESEGYVRVFAVATLADLGTITVGHPFALALDPTGTQLWVSSSVTGAVTVFHTADNSLAATIPLSGVPRHLAFSEIGTAVVANEANIANVVRQNP